MDTVPQFGNIIHKDWIVLPCESIELEAVGRESGIVDSGTPKVPQGKASDGLGLLAYPGHHILAMGFETDAILDQRREGKLEKTPNITASH